MIAEKNNRRIHVKSSTAKSNLRKSVIMQNTAKDRTIVID